MVDSRDHSPQWLKIIAVCVFSFGPSLMFLRHEFVYDDGAAIVKNADVANTSRPIIENIQDILVHDFWGQNISNKNSHKSYRPVTTLLFHTEYRNFDNAHLPGYMKRVNLLLHIVICCVLFDVLTRIFMDTDESILLNATLLFAAHPIHTEVICSVVGRADLVCAFFFLCTIGHFLDIIEDHERTQNVSWTNLAILLSASLACVMSKEVGIMVLPLCVVYDILTNFSLPRIRRREINRRFVFLRRTCQRIMIRSGYLTLMTFGLMLVRGFPSRYQLPQFAPQENPIAAHPSLFTRLLSSCYVHALNMWLLLCPDWLCCDWSHGTLQLIEKFTDYRIIFPILFYIYIIRTFIVGSRYVRIAVAFLVVPFIPSSNLFPIGFVLADRILYIPSIGFCLLIAYGAHILMLKSPKFIKTLGVMVLILLMARSNERSVDWQDNLQLFESAVRVCPNNSKVYYNLGQITAAKGNYTKSLTYNLIANRMQPNSVSTLINLGNAYRHLGHAQIAIEFHKNATTLDPEHPLAWLNLGISYVENDMLEESLVAYRKANKLRPNHVKILFNLGNLYLRMGDKERAERLYRRCIKIEPDSERAHINLIVYLSEHGTQDELMAAIDNANLTMSNNIPVLTAIASALTRINFDFERVERLYQRILKLDPLNFLAHVHLSIQYQKRNQPKKAMHHYDQARSLNQNFQIKDKKYLDFMEKWEATFANAGKSQKKNT